MKIRVRLAALALAALCAAAPASALAALGCESCCCPPSPCHQTAGDCEALGEAPCCEEAQPAVPVSAQRSAEAPGLHAVVPVGSLASVDSRRAYPAPRSDLEALVSPLRLSVVLRI